MRENALQRLIMLALGAEADLVFFKNSVGRAQYVDANGRAFFVPHGLGASSPDLVGILAPQGRWFCLEVKQPGETATTEQRRCHDLWRAFGAWVEVVTSVEEARDALERARMGARS